MEKLRIRIYKDDPEKPEVSIAIPLKVLQIAKKFIPSNVRQELQDEGIDLNEMISAVHELKDVGTIMEIEKEDQLIIIAVE